MRESTTLGSAFKSQHMVRALIVLLALTIPAAAQEVQIPPCAPHDEMAAELLTKAQESLVSIGAMPQQNAVMELYASRTGTWTVVVTTLPDGEACIKAYGTSLQMQLPPWKEQDAGQ